MKQVISIEHGGRISGLQHKPGKGIDLRQFGKCDIKRVSLVEWDADRQSWYVQFLEGPLAGQLLTEAHANDADERLIYTSKDDVSGVLYFDEYEMGVTAEIKMFNAFRRAGKLTSNAA